MSLHLKQSQRYLAKDWWDWSVWLEGTNEELAGVECVVYRLHESFPNPVREVTNRRTKFKLKCGGWGTFRIMAKVVNKDGSNLKLSHELELQYPEDEGGKD